MRKLKINLLAIIGLMVAVGTVAFTAPKEMEDNHWFAVDATETITEYIGTNPPGGDCNLNSSQLQLCAVKLADSQVDDPNAEEPTPKIEDLDEALDSRYRIPD